MSTLGSQDHRGDGSRRKEWQAPALSVLVFRATAAGVTSTADSELPGFFIPRRRRRQRPRPRPRRCPRHPRAPAAPAAHQGQLLMRGYNPRRGWSGHLQYARYDQPGHEQIET
jgi:hypothetical protein